MRQSSLVVVANRLPLDDNAAPDGACEWRRSPGGLASALHAILESTPATAEGALCPASSDALSDSLRDRATSQAHRSGAPPLTAAARRRCGGTALHQADRLAGIQLVGRPVESLRSLRRPHQGDHDRP